MKKIDAQNIPKDALVHEFCMQTDEDQARFTTSLSKFFPHRINRLGVIGGIGSGKSTLALGLINAFGLSTENARAENNNRGDWQSPDLGTIRIYDNFSSDYHRFNMVDDPEQDAGIVIVEHANIDRKPFDGVVMLTPGNGKPCVKDIKLVLPSEIANDPEYQEFLEETQDLLMHNDM